MPSNSSASRLLLVALLLAAPRAGAAATLYVNDAGADCAQPADHSSIQAAVDAAALGGGKRIHVCPGSYAELVSVDGFGRLTLEAEPGVTLRPPGPVSSHTLIDVRNSKKVVVRGFTLDGDGQFSGAGIYATGIGFVDASGTIEGNTILGIRPEPFAASLSHAIHVTDNEGDVKITIRGNTLAGYGQLGMDVTAHSVKILDNVLTGDGPTDVAPQAGIVLRDVQRGRVAGNVVDAHWFTPLRAAAGIYLGGAMRVRVDRNTLNDNYEGISVRSAALPSIRNTISNNDVLGAEFGIAVGGEAAAPADGNGITGNRVAGAGAGGTTGIEIGTDSLATRISGNEIDSFGAFVDDAGTGTKLKKNLCGGTACP
jgi:parallel beta-helix repeat protein